MATDMRELGSTGLKKMGGVVYEEYLNELTGSRWLSVVREMQDYPLVNAMLFLVEMQVRRVEWNVKPKDDSKSARKWADFVEECLGDMSFTWEDTISEIMSMFAYGFSLTEIVYKMRDDNKIGWRKWAIRSQNTISEWDFDENGGIRGVVQEDMYRFPPRTISIPIEKLLLFRTSSRKNNPEGRSFLRAAYRSYYLAKHLANVQAIFYERLNGIPVGRVPSQLLSANATAAQQAILSDMKEIVVNLRVDEQAGVILPSDRDEEGNRYYELELMRSDAGAGYDIEATIIRNHQEILMSILADVVMLGHTGMGSFNLAQVKMDNFWTGIDALVAGIAAIINKHAIPRLMKLNAVPEKYWPSLKPGSVQRIDLDALGQYLVRMAGSGISLEDAELQAYLLRQANMPVSTALEEGKIVRPAPNQAQGSMEDVGRSSREATRQRNTQGEGENGP